jgi:hypothetical protein
LSSYSLSADSSSSRPRGHPVLHSHTRATTAKNSNRKAHCAIGTSSPGCDARPLARAQVVDPFVVWPRCPDTHWEALESCTRAETFKVFQCADVYGHMRSPSCSIYWPALATAHLVCTASEQSQPRHTELAWGSWLIARAATPFVNCSQASMVWQLQQSRHVSIPTCSYHPAAVALWAAQELAAASKATACCHKSTTDLPPTRQRVCDVNDHKTTHNHNTKHHSGNRCSHCLARAIEAREALPLTHARLPEAG